MNIAHYLISIILGYLIGSTMPGFWIGKYFYHTDIRDSGSGNIGTTNTFRILGMAPGIVTMIIDILKGTLATLIPYLLNFDDVNPIIPGIFAVLGHVFSPWINFKGGKAVATSAGVVLAINPLLFLLIAATFAFLIFLTSTVSLSAIATSIISIFYSLYFNNQSNTLTIAVIIMSIILIYRHRLNIERIINLNERTIPFGLLYWLRKKS